MEIMNMEIMTDAMTSDRADVGSRGNLSIPDQFGDDQSAAWFTQYLDAVLAPIAQRVDQ
jgi:hypothetical protein